MRVEVSLALSLLLAQNILSAQNAVCVPADSLAVRDIASGEVKAGQTCTISSTETTTNGTLKNSGTIILESGSSLQFNNTTPPESNTISIITDGTNRGKIEVKGNASIVSASSTSGGADLKIEGQDITINSGSVFVLKAGGTAQSPGASAKEGQLSLILGDSGKGVTFFSKERSEIQTEGFISLQTTDVSFTNTSLTSKTLTTLKNTKTTLSNASISSSQNLTISGENGSSSFEIKQTNLIHSSEGITLSGGVTHSFSGTGILDFQADKNAIVLGNGTDPKSTTLTLTLQKAPSAFNTQESKEELRIGLKGKVQIKDLKVEGLKLEALSDKKSTLENAKLELSDSTLSATSLDRKTQQGLEIINEANKKDSYGKITITADKTATLLGNGIEIYGQEITFSNGSAGGYSAGKSTLILESDLGKGTITLGRVDTKSSVQNLGTEAQTNKDGAVSLSSTTGANLYLDAKSTFFGVLTLDNLDVFAHTKEQNSGVILSGNGSDSVLNLGKEALAKPYEKSAGTLTLSTADRDGANYQDLTITNIQFKGNSTINVNQSTTIKAASLAVQNQNITLKPTNGVASTLTLYAFGKDEKAKFGNFSFRDTSITNGSSAEVKLVSNNGAKLRASNLTLEGVKFTSIKNENGLTTQTSLDLSTRADSINVLGTTSIEAQGVLTTGQKSGFGMDIKVGNATKTGQLTIKDTSNPATTSFLIDGSLTLDNRAGKNGGNGYAETNGTSFDVELGTNNRQAPLKLSTQTLALEIQGGLRAIGTSTNKLEVKAKNFVFGDQSYLHIQDTELTLNVKDNGPIELKGTTALEGTSANEAKLVSKKDSNGNAGLKLHDIIARGKASISDNLSFVNSTILVEGRGKDAKTFTLKNTGGSDGKMSGIASITLKDADIVFQKNGGSPSSAEVELNTDSLITSSGDSSLQAQTLKIANGVQKTQASGITLKVLDGTFTLKEDTAGDALGEITLGTKENPKGGNLVLLKDSAKQVKQGEKYNTFTLKGILTSYGDSSITASNFTLSSDQTGNVLNTENALSLTSNSGELKIIKDNTMQQGLQATGDALSLGVNLNLNNGSFGYYTISANQRATEPALSALKLGSGVKVTSTGDSTIKATTLTLNDNDFHITEGTLTLTGIQEQNTNSLAPQATESNKMGNLYVGNAGGLLVLSQGETQSTLSLKSGASITLGAKVGFVSEKQPLGEGKFGNIVAKKIVFGGDSTGNKLINIVINSPQESPTQKLTNDSLFALQEGEVALITTQDGIKKTLNPTLQTQGTGEVDITLEDITLNKDRFSSLTLTPILKTAGEEGSKYVKDLVLGVKVSQTNANELLESIQDPQDQEAMKNLIQNDDNAMIIDAILKDPNNPLRVGVAEYFSSGNVGVMQDALDKIKTTFANFASSVEIDDKIYEELLMIRQSNTEARRVRASNPFSSTEEIASLLQKASKYRYASTELFVPQEQDLSHQVWATYDGAIDVGSAQKSSVNGLSAGYDLMLGESKEYLLGMFASYGYGTYSTSTLQDTSHNVGLGLYTRMFFGGNEVDLSLSQSVGLHQLQNQIKDSTSTLASILNQGVEYNFYATDLQFSYGYTFKVGEEENPYFLKPFVGTGFAFIHNSGGQGDGIASVAMSSSTQYRIDVSLGMEMRKYLNADTFFYLLPLLEVNALNTGGGTQVGFNSNLVKIYHLNDESMFNLGIYAGGQGNITQQLSITGGFGAKASLDQKDVLTNWNVGLRYKF